MIISYGSPYRFSFSVVTFALIWWVFSCNSPNRVCFGLCFRIRFSFETFALISWVFSCNCWKWTGFDLVKRKLAFRLAFNFSKNFRWRIIFDLRPYLYIGLGASMNDFRLVSDRSTQTVSFFYTVEHSHTEEKSENTSHIAQKRT